MYHISISTCLNKLIFSVFDLIDIVYCFYMQYKQDPTAFMVKSAFKQELNVEIMVKDGSAKSKHFSVNFLCIYYLIDIKRSVFPPPQEKLQKFF